MYIKGRFFTSRKYPEPDGEGIFYDFPKNSPISAPKEKNIISSNKKTKKTQTEKIKDQTKIETFHKNSTKTKENNERIAKVEISTSEKMEKILDEAFEEIEKLDRIRQKTYDHQFIPQIKDNSLPKNKFNSKQNELFSQIENSEDSYQTIIKNENITSTSTSSYYSSDDDFLSSISNKYQINTSQKINRSKKLNSQNLAFATPQIQKNPVNKELFHSAKPFQSARNPKNDFNLPSNVSPVKMRPLRISGSMSPMEPMTPLDIRFQRNFESFVQNSNSSSKKQQSKSPVIGESNEEELLSYYSNSSKDSDSLINQNYSKKNSMKSDSIKKNSMKSDTINKNSMKNDSIKKNSMKSDTINKNSMKSESIKKNSMKSDTINKNSMKSDSIKKNSMKSGSIKGNSLNDEINTPIKIPNKLELLSSSDDGSENSNEYGNESSHSNTSKSVLSSYETEDSDIKHVNQNYIKNFKQNNYDDYTSYSSSIIRRAKKSGNQANSLIDTANDDYEYLTSSTISQINAESKSKRSTKPLQIPSIDFLLSENGNEEVILLDEYKGSNNSNNYSYYESDTSNKNTRKYYNKSDDDENDDSYFSTDEFVRSRLDEERIVKSTMNRNGLANSLSPHPNNFWMKRNRKDKQKMAKTSNPTKNASLRNKTYTKDEKNDGSTKSEIEINEDSYEKSSSFILNNLSLKNSNKSDKFIIIQNDSSPNKSSKSKASDALYSNSNQITKPNSNSKYSSGSTPNKNSKYYVSSSSNSGSLDNSDANKKINSVYSTPVGKSSLISTPNSKNASASSPKETFQSNSPSKYNSPQGENQKISSKESRSSSSASSMKTTPTANSKNNSKSSTFSNKSNGKNSSGSQMLNSKSPMSDHSSKSNSIQYNNASSKAESQEITSTNSYNSKDRLIYNSSQAKSSSQSVVQQVVLDSAKRTSSNSTSSRHSSSNSPLFDKNSGSKNLLQLNEEEEDESLLQIRSGNEMNSAEYDEEDKDEKQSGVRLEDVDDDDQYMQLSQHPIESSSGDNNFIIDGDVSLGQNESNHDVNGKEESQDDVMRHSSPNSSQNQSFQLSQHPIDDSQNQISSSSGIGGKQNYPHVTISDASKEEILIEEEEEENGEVDKEEELIDNEEDEEDAKDESGIVVDDANDSFGEEEEIEEAVNKVDGVFDDEEEDELINYDNDHRNEEEEEEAQIASSILNGNKTGSVNLSSEEEEVQISSNIFKGSKIDSVNLNSEEEEAQISSNIFKGSKIDSVNLSSEEEEEEEAQVASNIFKGSKIDSVNLNTEEEEEDYLFSDQDESLNSQIKQAVGEQSREEASATSKEEAASSSISKDKSAQNSNLIDEEDEEEENFVFDRLKDSNEIGKYEEDEEDQLDIESIKAQLLNSKNKTQSSIINNQSNSSSVINNHSSSIVSNQSNSSSIINNQSDNVTSNNSNSSINQNAKNILANESGTASNETELIQRISLSINTSITSTGSQAPNSNRSSQSNEFASINRNAEDDDEADVMPKKSKVEKRESGESSDYRDSADVSQNENIIVNVHNSETSVLRSTTSSSEISQVSPLKTSSNEVAKIPNVTNFDAVSSMNSNNNKDIFLSEDESVEEEEEEANRSVTNSSLGEKFDFAENQEIPSDFDIYKFEEEENGNNEFESSASTLSSFLAKQGGENFGFGKSEEEEEFELASASSSMPHSENEVEKITNSDLISQSRDDNSTAPFTWERLKDPNDVNIGDFNSIGDAPVRKDDEKVEVTEIKIDFNDKNPFVNNIVDDADDENAEMSYSSNNSRIHDTAGLIKEIDNVLKEFGDDDDNENDET